MNMELQRSNSPLFVTVPPTLPLVSLFFKNSTFLIVLPNFRGSDGSSASASSNFVTLIGDSAHPMSPFKGQGANQSIIDGLNLARAIGKGGLSKFLKFDGASAPPALLLFETEMMERVSEKVLKSREAAGFLHTMDALKEGDCTRGGAREQSGDKRKR